MRSELDEIPSSRLTEVDAYRFVDLSLASCCTTPSDVATLAKLFSHCCFLAAL